MTSKKQITKLANLTGVNTREAALAYAKYKNNFDKAYTSLLKEKKDEEEKEEEEEEEEKQKISDKIIDMLEYIVLPVDEEADAEAAAKKKKKKKKGKVLFEGNMIFKGEKRRAKLGSLFEDIKTRTFLS